jgi:hypothetical protein
MSSWYTSMLSVVMLGDVILSVVMLSVIKLSVGMLSVIKLSVVRYGHAAWHYTECRYAEY